MISALKMESGNEHKTGSEAADGMCQNNNESNIQLFCITISLFEHLELLELRAA